MELIARILVIAFTFVLTLLYILFGKENEKVKRIMDNFYVRMTFITIIVLSTKYDPLLALFLSIIFIFRYKDNSLK